MERESGKYSGVEHSQPVEFDGWASAVVADGSHGFVNSRPPGRSVWSSELAGGAEAYLVESFSESFESGKTFVEMPDGCGVSFGELAEKVGFELVIVLFGPVDFVGYDDEVAGGMLDPLECKFDEAGEVMFIALPPCGKRAVIQGKGLGDFGDDLQTSRSLERDKAMSPGSEGDGVASASCVANAVVVNHLDSHFERIRTPPRW